MSYPRRPGQSMSDRERARAVEEEVGRMLGSFKIDNTTSPDRLDFWVPGLFIEVKGKYQKIGSRWPLPCDERDAFILDELSVRKAMAHYPHAYIIFFDEPTGRRFFARIDEVACAEHTRVNRVGPTGVAKGKWVVSLAHFRRLNEGDDLLTLLLADQIATPWKSSACLSQMEIPCA